MEANFVKLTPWVTIILYNVLGEGGWCKYTMTEANHVRWAHSQLLLYSVVGDNGVQSLTDWFLFLTPLVTRWPSLSDWLILTPQLIGCISVGNEANLVRLDHF